MNLLDIVSYILGIGMSLILGIVKLIIVIIIAAIAYFKGYHAGIWAGITLILPWPVPIFTLLLMSFLPKKLPKLPLSLRNSTAFKDKNPVIASVMALCAMIAKADGSVTKEEIRYIKDFVGGRFHISDEEMNDYEGAFNYGKNHPDEYIVFTELIRKYYRTRRDYIMVIAYLFEGLSAENDEISDVKEVQLKRIILALGLSEYEYQMLRNAHRYENAEQGYYNSYAEGMSTPSKEMLIKKYSEVLGVSENASLSEIKKAYRKQVKEYHPDRLNSENVPPDYIEFANKKIREINEAYEYLEKVK